jgi:hypothetical protein
VKCGSAVDRLTSLRFLVEIIRRGEMRSAADLLWGIKAHDSGLVARGTALNLSERFTILVSHPSPPIFTDAAPASIAPSDYNSR